METFQDVNVGASNQADQSKYGTANPKQGKKLEIVEMTRQLLCEATGHAILLDDTV
jgi:hypothetical protein